MTWRRALLQVSLTALSAASTASRRTAWCGCCKRAKAWLAERKIPFVEKDIEQEPDAQKELDAAKRAAGISQGGVPVIDVGGQLIFGFDVPALERRFPQ